jgi:hypothetical protein
LPVFSKQFSTKLVSVFEYELANSIILHPVEFYAEVVYLASSNEGSVEVTLEEQSPRHMLTSFIKLVTDKSSFNFFSIITTGRDVSQTI